MSLCGLWFSASVRPLFFNPGGEFVVAFYIRRHFYAHQILRRRAEIGVLLNRFGRALFLSFVRLDAGFRKVVFTDRRRIEFIDKVE